MNLCLKCHSYYDRPGTCNCFAVQPASPFPQPWPQTWPDPWVYPSPGTAPPPLDPFRPFMTITCDGSL